MGAIALPTFSLHMSLPDDGTASLDDSKRTAYDLVTDGFGPGFNGPLAVTVSPTDPAAVQAAVGAAATKLSTLDNVHLAIPAGVAGDGSMGVIQVIPATGPSDERTETLVDDIRDIAGDLGRSARTSL